MPSVAIKLYSAFFKLFLKHRLQSRVDAIADEFGVTSRPEESTAPANPSFAADGVATKDIHIDPLTALSLRIFLPDSFRDARPAALKPSFASDPDLSVRANGFSYPAVIEADRRSYDGPGTGAAYQGYLPSPGVFHRAASRRLPVILQFHGGGFVSGSNTSTANDFFCRRIAKLLDVIIIAVGYRLAPESRYPAAFDDGLKVMYWLAKQANLVECNRSFGNGRGGDARRMDSQRHIVDAFGAATMEPWLAAHADFSSNQSYKLLVLVLLAIMPVFGCILCYELQIILCVLLGVSCGANIADFVARKAVEAGKLLDPIKVVAQVLMYPFFIGTVPTHSEIKLANSYFYDKATCILAWKLFLPEAEFNLDHPAANPLMPGRAPPLKCMLPTLVVVAEHDWMRDRAIAYSEELRKVNVDSPVLEYKDAVHEFATLNMLLKTPQAQACCEDIAIWVKKYISTRGHEFSY
ncbi:putative carboxylesterase 11 [Apostasia shenzhenica]|uniref:Putative carboxylesterase 11 n=1 Tax=Apostasia shenzhenica TaxID=1088818 RepID=A0A2I0AGL1_9ASPA|nr:putative carboxylesterase 11 [Apostasia shenzhenica]